MRGWNCLLIACCVLTTAGAAPSAEPAGNEPFLGAYVHLPAWFRDKADQPLGFISAPAARK